MSALAAALAAFASAQPVVLPPDDDMQLPPPPAPVPVAQPVPLVLPPLSHSASTSSSSSLYDTPVQPPAALDRPNDHLAVLLPKHLWKPDNLATVCDNFYCRVTFGLFERRHHCRKCGGIFCGACTSRTTPLLDTAALPFVHPPRNHRITEFESPDSPISNSRVCDDCWDQVYGIPTSPHTPTRPATKRALTHPVTAFKFPLASTRDGSDCSLSSRGSLSRKTRSLRPSPSSSSLNTTSSTHSNAPKRSVLRTSHVPIPCELERSYGELDAYPLRRSSVLCKAAGGGRWEPKHSPVLDGYRPPVPGGKAPFELEMERQEREERLRKENPIITDGDFRYRFVRHQPKTLPVLLSRSPFTLSTF